jgi:hypothetical protein
VWGFSALVNLNNDEYSTLHVGPHLLDTRHKDWSYAGQAKIFDRESCLLRWRIKALNGLYRKASFRSHTND